MAPQVTMDQRRTAFLRYDGIPFDSLVRALFDAAVRNDITCMQLTRRSTLKLTMKDPQALRALAAKQLVVNGKPISFRLLGETTTTLLIKDLPYWVNGSQIKQDLSPYGVPADDEVTREVHKTGPLKGIQNGDRIVVMKTMPRNVPNLAVIRGFKVQIFYPGVVHQCFICQGTDHMSGACPRRRKRPVREELPPDPPELPPPPESEEIEESEEPAVIAETIPSDVDETSEDKIVDSPVESVPILEQSASDLLSFSSANVEDTVDSHMGVEKEDNEEEIVKTFPVSPSEVTLFRNVGQVSRAFATSRKENTSPSFADKAKMGVRSGTKSYVQRMSPGNRGSAKKPKRDQGKDYTGTSSDDNMSTEDDDEDNGN